MAQAAAPWYPKPCLAPHLGATHHTIDGETFDENVVYYKFVKSDGKSVVVQVRRILDTRQGIKVVNDKITVPANKGADFPRLGNDISTYSKELKDQIERTVRPIMQMLCGKYLVPEPIDGVDPRTLRSILYDK